MCTPSVHLQFLVWVQDMSVCRGRGGVGLLERATSVVRHYLPAMTIGSSMVTCTYHIVLSLVNVMFQIVNTINVLQDVFSMHTKPKYGVVITKFIFQNSFVKYLDDNWL